MSDTRLERKEKPRQGGRGQSYAYDKILRVAASAAPHHSSQPCPQHLGTFVAPSPPLGSTNSPNPVRGWRKAISRPPAWRRSGRSRLAPVAERCGRRGGFFQNTGLLECACNLIAGVEQLDCASRRQHNSRHHMSLAGWLVVRRFRFVQAGRAKFESGAFDVEKTLAQAIGECFLNIVSLFLRKLPRWFFGWHERSSWVSALSERPA